MTTRRLVVSQILIILFVAVILAVAWALLPGTLFEDDQFVTLATFVTALVAASVTGASSYFLSRYAERPLVRIKHVDFKSEREAFSLDEDLWWHLTHGSIMGYIRNQSEWLINPLWKNELQHFHLRDLEEVVDHLIKTYSATSAWTRELLKSVQQFAQAPSDQDRVRIIEDLAPQVERFEDHYREAGEGVLFRDLREDPAKAAGFLEAEIQGLLLQHGRDLDAFNNLKSWIDEKLRAGLNSPKPIDHRNNEVPTIRVFIGVVNVGSTPGLIRSEVDLLFRGRTIPLRPVPSTAQILYTKVDPLELFYLAMSVYGPGCAFQDQVRLYKALTDVAQDEHCDVVLSMADGTTVKESEVVLFDNSELRV